MKRYLDDDTASALLAKLLKCERAADPLLVLRVEDDPAGRSSRAAYQTCRVGASFGRAIGPTRDDGLDFAPWHAAQGNACGFRQSKVLAGRRPTLLLWLAERTFDA